LTYTSASINQPKLYFSVEHDLAEDSLTGMNKNNNTHTHPFNGPLSGSTQVSRYQKVKPIWMLLEQETVSGSGISWAICKSTRRSRQITTPAPHHSVFTGRMPFLTPNHQLQSTEGSTNKIINKNNKTV